EDGQDWHYPLPVGNATNKTGLRCVVLNITFNKVTAPARTLFSGPRFTHAAVLVLVKEL
ncbi:hypothetical protein LCGC14_2282100, partial [marine sediment metagenome]